MTNQEKETDKSTETVKGRLWTCPNEPTRSDPWGIGYDDYIAEKHAVEGTGSDCLGGW